MVVGYQNILIANGCLNILLQGWIDIDFNNYWQINHTSCEDIYTVNCPQPATTLSTIHFVYGLVEKAAH